jgi:hypothetical protein
MPLSGRNVVDVSGGTLTVRPILKERRSYKAGAPLMEFSVTPVAPDEG